MENQEKWFNAVVKRLDILIALGLETPIQQPDVTMTDKIAKLVDLGVAPSDVARILGKPVNYVTGALSSRRKRRKAKKA